MRIPKTFVTFEAIKRQGFPARSWYHPSVALEPRAEFLQTPDGTLCCRVGINGACPGFSGGGG